MLMVSVTYFVVPACPAAWQIVTLSFDAVTGAATSATPRTRVEIRARILFFIEPLSACVEVEDKSVRVRRYAVPKLILLSPETSVSTIDFVNPPTLVSDIEKPVALRSSRIIDLLDKLIAGKVVPVRHCCRHLVEPRTEKEVISIVDQQILRFEEAHQDVVLGVSKTPDDPHHLGYVRTFARATRCHLYDSLGRRVSRSDSLWVVEFTQDGSLDCVIDDVKVNLHTTSL